uniref:Uncharacterized protein n=1 Tax=Rhizophora mucronata TaxID=61149 RepID=A0A2P2MCL3_RHIMU
MQQLTNRIQRVKLPCPFQGQHSVANHYMNHPGKMKNQNNVAAFI